jgi:methylthioribose-1-phosphate isomerase
MRGMEWTGREIRVLDQTRLPKKETWLTLSTTAQLAGAIKAMRIRGAPALGIAGAYGVAQAAVRSRANTARGAFKEAERAGAVLALTRPTAINLSWAIRRTLDAGLAAIQAGADRDGLVKTLAEEANAIADEDARACDAISQAGQSFVPPRATILTHCNTGLLCTGGAGTALGVIALAHTSGKDIRVLATETRPLLQGARLTAWELGKLGIPHALIPDAAGPALLARGVVDLVLVGADRIAANGDVANKIGTYSLALAAREAGVPFVVAAPVSTIDLAVADGAAIPVEERSPDEVLSILGTRVAPAGATALNPAFDVTPAGLVTAVVTERGVAGPPFTESLRRVMQPSG